MRISVRHVLDEAEIRRTIGGPESGIARDMMRRGRNVERLAKRKCPRDHGDLASSIHTELIRYRGSLGVEVGTDVYYAIWVHEGTGLYGPRHALIYPRTAKVMVWQPRFTGKGPTRKLIPYRQRISASNKVVARWTRGMKGTPFLRDALPAARP